MYWEVITLIDNIKPRHQSSNSRKHMLHWYNAVAIIDAIFMLPDNFHCCHHIIICGNSRRSPSVCSVTESVHVMGQKDDLVHIDLFHTLLYFGDQLTVERMRGAQGV